MKNANTQMNVKPTKGLLVLMGIASNKNDLFKEANY